MYGPGGGVGRRRRERSPIIMTAMAITTAPPTAPPMIAAVFELFFLEEPESGESPDVGNDEPVGNGVVKAGKFVGLAVFVPVGPGPEVEEFEPINAPGPISGVPKTHRCEADNGKKDREEDSYHRWPSPRENPKGQDLGAVVGH